MSDKLRTICVVKKKGKSIPLQAWTGRELSDKLRTICVVKKKGKAIPLQAWTGREGSRRFRLPDFKTIGT